MPSIVISYRRADTGQIAGRIFDRLEAHFGRDSVFMDIDGIPIGADFRDRVKSVLDDCAAVVALVGPHWADGGSHRDRLADEADWVRIEIETALANKVPVIPVLIDQSQFPPATDVPPTMRDIVFKQAARVDTGVDFGPHMERLIRALDTHFESPAKNVQLPKPVKAAETAAEPSRIVIPPETRARSPAATDLTTSAASFAHFFSFRGRIGRRQWWTFAPAYFGVMAFTVLFWAVADQIGPGNASMWLLLALLYLCVVVGMAGSARRLHDIGQTGWWTALLPPMPVVVFAASVVPGDITWMLPALALVLLWAWGISVLGYRDGEAGANRFGPPPA